jgi:signal transduction histidine kinase
MNSSDASTALRITLLYAVVASLWILLSGHLFTKVGLDSGRLIGLGSYKDWGFVVITTLLLYYLLNREFQRRQGMEKAMRQQTRELDERVKELHCLYAISSLVDRPSISLEQIFQAVVELIPPAWQYPQITCARIIFQDQEFRTAGFKETDWKQTADIKEYNELIGAVEVYYLAEKPEGEEGPFLKEERSLLTTIAEQLGKTVERTRAEEALQKIQDELEQRVEERTRELSTLLKVSYTAASTLELEPLLGLILDQLKTIVDYTSVSILTLAEEVTVLAYRGPVPQEKALQFHFLAKSAWADQELLRPQKPVIIPDVWADTSLTRVFREKGGQRLQTTFSYIRSWLGVPLLVKDQLVGFLSLSHNEPDRYSPRQAELTFALANQAAVAIENARLYSATKQHANELETLFAVQQAITSHLEPDAVLQLIADEARRLTDSRLSLVYLPDGENLRIAVLSGEYGPDIIVGYQMPIAQSVAGRSLQTGQPITVEDAQNDPRIYADVIRRLGVRSYLTVPLISMSEPLGVIAVADREAGTLEPDDERILTMLASGAVIALENAHLYQQEYERRRELEALYRADEELYRHLWVEQVLQSLADVAVDILEADKSSLFVWDDRREQLEVGASRGFRPETIEQISLSSSEVFLGRVAVKNELVVIEDARSDSRLAKKLVESEGIHSLVLVPIEINGEMFGIFNLNYGQPRVFNDDQRRLFAALARRAALAIENARLYEQAQQAAVLEERQRLARELHDAVTQTLFSASLIAEVLPRLWRHNQAEGERRLEELRQLARGALAEMRTLLLELRPAALTEANLDELLRHLTEAITGRARTPVTLSIEGDCRLPPEVQVGLYRITQEALNNVAKHAKASRATVSLWCQSQRVEMRIKDDGRGFEPGQVSPEHLGLSIMRERAETIGATFKLESRPGQGTEIEVVWTKSPPKEQR